MRDLSRIKMIRVAVLPSPSTSIAAHAPLRTLTYALSNFFYYYFINIIKSKVKEALDKMLDSPKRSAQKNSFTIYCNRLQRSITD